MSEWNEFKIGEPAKAGFNNQCRPFDLVYHVSHARPALDIIQSRQIRPGLVFDESKLNDKRILVAWVSPNYWNPGFRYGTAGFLFHFADLIEGKNFYWVESIAYKTKACRILVTDKDRGEELETYDPSAKDGPWWYDEGKGIHYFNGKYCLELMVEAPILLEMLAQFEFVPHNGEHCSIHRDAPQNCRELGSNAQDGGALFLAHAVADRADLSFLKPLLVNEEGKVSAHLPAALSRYWWGVCKGAGYHGDIDISGPTGPTLARAILSAFAANDMGDVEELRGHFKSEEHLYDALLLVTAEILGFDDWKILKVN